MRKESFAVRARPRRLPAARPFAMAPSAARDQSRRQVGRDDRRRPSRSRGWPALVLGLLLVCGCGQGEEDGVRRGSSSQRPFLLGGIQVREPDMEHWLDTLDRVGFNAISVTVYARQGRWDRAELSSDAREDWVVPEIRAAKERGLAVVLVLRIALEHALDENLFLWHGMIQPRDAATLEEWFEAYAGFVERWARVAAAEGVEVLGIGSELNALASTRPVGELPVLEEYYLNAEKQAAQHEKLLAFEEDVDTRHLKAGWGRTYESLPRFLDERTAAHHRWAEQVTFGGDVDAINRHRASLDAAWRRLIGRVREVFGGRLTYAANFDQYPMIGFWDALDLIGINAYFPLRDGSEKAESTADLLPVFERSWTEVMKELLDFRRRRGLGEMPVLFTELGYTYRAGSTIHPWAGSGFEVLAPGERLGGGEGASALVVYDEQPVNLEERALAVRALRASVERVAPNLLHGLLYWKLSTVEAHREIEPFVLVVAPDGDDPLQSELLAFVDPDRSPTP